MLEVWVPQTSIILMFCPRILQAPFYSFKRLHFAPPQVHQKRQYSSAMSFLRTSMAQPA